MRDQNVMEALFGTREFLVKQKLVDGYRGSEVR